MWRADFFMRVLTLLFLALMNSGLRAETVATDPEVERIDLSERMEILRDAERRIEYADVVAMPDAFRHASRQDLVTSFNAGSSWLRLALKNDSAYPLTRWLVVGSAKTQRVSLYLRRDGVIEALQSGRTVAVAERPLETMAPVFPLKLVPGEQMSLLMRVDARGATDMATTLWEPQAYRHAEGSRQMQLAAILAGLLVSALLALMVFATMRETPYLWLGLFLAAIAGLEATRSNFLGTYLWPDAYAQPGWTLAVFALGAVFSLSKVIAHALDLARWLPRADRLLQALRWIAVAGAAVALFSYGHGVLILSATSIVHSIATLVLSLWAWYLGRKAGRFFLLAFSIALLTEIARQLANLGWLPWIAAMEFSTLFFLLASPLILLGLADRTRQLGEQLRVSEQLQQAKSEFIARVSHELRSPLNTILGFNRMLARGSTRLTLAEGTAGIEKSTLRLLHLIDELLDEARAAAGKLTVSPAPMTLQPWLDEIARNARVQIEAKGNRLLCAFSGDLSGAIHADGERLRQVLENLFSNANRHARQGTIRFECAAHTLEQKTQLHFAIEDNGSGIAPERLQLIFEPFVHGAATTPDPGRHGSGFGLGLPICRELLRQMGSDIEVVSTLGRGSRFSFSLHCRAVAQEELPAPDAPTLSANSPKVLLVDDDVVQLDQLTDLFAEAGFAVVAVSGGQAALARLDEEDWDAVVTDQAMPGMDGWSLLRAVRARKPALPVILYSSGLPDRPADVPAELHFDASLRKPASAEEMLAAVWRSTLKAAGVAPALDWTQLAQLAREGDVSGIEDWIAAARHTAHEHECMLKWFEGALYRLDFSLLERCAALIA